MIFILKFYKGHNSVNSVGGVIVLLLSTLPDFVLYLDQVLSKYLIRFQSYSQDRVEHYMRIAKKSRYKCVHNALISIAFFAICKRINKRTNQIAP